MEVTNHARLVSDESHIQMVGMMQVAVLGDVHVSPGIQAEDSLHQAVDEINQGGIDAVLVPGDVSNRGANEEFAAVKRQLSRLKVPYAMVTGNHDTNWSPTAGQGWLQFWASERVDLSLGGCRIVGFSTGPYMKMGNGFVRSDDLIWLEQTLKKHAGETIVLLAHYPLTEGLGNWQAVQELLHRYPVDLVVGGHVHVNQVYDYDGIPGLLCRALINPQGTGYGILSLTEKQISFSEKLLGKNPRTLASLQRERKTWDAEDVQTLPAVQTLPSWPECVRQIWRDSATVYTRVAVQENVLFYGTSTGRIKAVDFVARQLKWEQSVGGQVYSTPVCYNGVLAVGCVNNRILGLDVKTGQPVWEVSTDAPVSADGTVCKGMLYIGDSAGNFWKIDMATGAVLFRAKVAQERFQARPWVEEETVFAPAWDNHIYGIDAETGRMRWAWTHGKACLLFSPGNSTPVVADGKVFIATPDRYLNALDCATGKEIYRSNACTYRESIGLSQDARMVYAKTMNAELVAVPVEDSQGTIAWKVPLGWGAEYEPCPILEHHGRIYLGSLNGNMAVVTRDAGHEMWQTRLGFSGFNGFTPLPCGGVLVSMIDGGIFQVE